MKELQTIKIGEIGVDSGLVYVGDPCYVWPDERRDDKPSAIEAIGSWKDFCTKIHEKKEYPIRHSFGMLGVVATSGMGDGVYPVYATIEDGMITSLTVKFLEDDDEPEEDEESDETP